MRSHPGHIAAATWIVALIASCSPPGPTAAGNASASESTTDQAAVGSLSLKIVNRAGECWLLTGSKELALTPKAPCYFVQAPGGQRAWSFEYPDINTSATLIVIGTPAKRATRKLWNLAENVVCGEESQGVLVRKGELVVTKQVHRGGLYCRDRGTDEKEFYAFAHEEK